MIEKPDDSEIVDLVGEESFSIWKKICTFIENKYKIDIVWNNGGKKWKYECKFICGSKTLCGLYAKENDSGFMIIFGKTECEKVEKQRCVFSQKLLKIYDEENVYHDGKWVMFPLVEDFFDEFKYLLEIKRIPNKYLNLC